jgi:ATP-dependent helicase HrpA
MVPSVTYPSELPIASRIGDIATAIRAHQVVIVAGETGSGKTTQLPKICLELGRGVGGTIAHTQPRRLAARTVAERIAGELGTQLGQAVGYQVRFDARTSPDSMITVMTDGILLAAIRSDPKLRAYDTIILDEAHERSLNIDFLIGYLTRLLPKRPDLKLVITSATIDPDAFSRHFDDAPIIEVSGRTYPVEVRYRPPGDDEDQAEAIRAAVMELREQGPGDILVFCSGEREIRDAADALRRWADLHNTDILPLYARLASAGQHKVFAPHSRNRVVLATNVAETSLTVPGIRYVIDTGLARMSRYSARLKVQRLPIEKISQASADQRKGRCGRQSDGICIRLYSEEDFHGRSRFTEPEILRTHLASVLLQMAALRLGEVRSFPFLDPPDARQIRDGLILLDELGAIKAGESRSGQARLTKTGKSLARLPIEPRFGRMIIAGHEYGCMDEVLVIAAGLAIPDPRQRPAEHKGAADELHARFTDEDSDFTSMLALIHAVSQVVQK